MSADDEKPEEVEPPTSATTDPEPTPESAPATPVAPNDATATDATPAPAPTGTEASRSGLGWLLLGFLFIALGAGCAFAALNGIYQSQETRKRVLAEFGEIDDPKEQLRTDLAPVGPIQLFLGWGIFQFLAMFVVAVNRKGIGYLPAALFWLLWLCALVGPFVAMGQVL
ncbi:MAG: hypothetical protein AB7K24_10890 [Gemmataceae bacterium]